ncbi:unnamed protein product [Parajaminaea phylloscopi]
MPSRRRPPRKQLATGPPRAFGSRSPAQLPTSPSVRPELRRSRFHKFPGHVAPEVQPNAEGKAPCPSPDCDSLGPKVIAEVYEHLNRDHGYYPRPDNGIPEDAEWGLDPQELQGFLLWAGTGDRADRIDEAVVWGWIQHREDQAAWKAFDEWKDPSEKKLNLSAGPIDSVPSALVVARHALQELAAKALSKSATHEDIRDALAGVDYALATIIIRHPEEAEWSFDTGCACEGVAVVLDRLCVPPQIAREAPSEVQMLRWAGKRLKEEVTFGDLESWHEWAGPALHCFYQQPRAPLTPSRSKADAESEARGVTMGILVAEWKSLRTHIKDSWHAKYLESQEYGRGQTPEAPPQVTLNL